MSLSASLPDAWISRIFGALRATYGAAFDRQWAPPGGCSPEESAGYAEAVKAHWAHDLAGYIRAPNAIAYALDNLPENPPNLVQFKALCQRRPAAAALQLPAPEANPARVAAELAQMRSAVGARGPLQWAYDLQERESAETAQTAPGVRMTPFQRQCWREALASSAADEVDHAVGVSTVPIDAMPPRLRDELERERGIKRRPGDPAAEYATTAGAPT